MPHEMMGGMILERLGAYAQLGGGFQGSCHVEGHRYEKHNLMVGIWTFSRNLVSRSPLQLCRIDRSVTISLPPTISLITFRDGSSRLVKQPSISKASSSLVNGSRAELEPQSTSSNELEFELL
ncbi:hypothetical protein OSB04_002020 [Centaurea solstitialis]|uniref:Uncharacterized protein n=1 Tax=Centaurea solstitialis TaxID=347529 RepID=A0AA38TSH6_9ASTR|nr:hypothetical protein OSB04_002020 [Centaurea solstitialis]